jgi:hypothetical protein
MRLSFPAVLTTLAASAVLLVLPAAASADPPALASVAAPAAWTQGDNSPNPPVDLAPDVMVTADDTMVRVVVQATNGPFDGDDVGFDPNPSTMGDIHATGAYALGTLTLVGSPGTTDAQWEAALRTLWFNNHAPVPGATTRGFTLTGYDDVDAAGPALTRTVAVTATDQTPIVTTTGPATTYRRGDPAVAVDTGLTVSDADNGTLAVAVVKVTGNAQSGDTLSFINTTSTLYGNIVPSYNAATMVLTLTSSGATATLAQWQAALRAVTFSTGGTSDTAARTIAFQVSDGTKTSAARTKVVAFAVAPTIGVSAGSASWVQGAPPVVLDPGLTLTDDTGIDHVLLPSPPASTRARTSWRCPAIPRRPASPSPWTRPAAR